MGEKWLQEDISGGKLMVEKKVPDVEREFYTKKAKEIKTPSLNLRLAHKRKSYEMNLNKNCKVTVEKKLSKAQQELSLQVSEAQKIKDEKYINRKRKK